MAFLFDWIFSALLSFGIEYIAFVLVDVVVKSLLKDAVTDKEKRNIWLLESVALIVVCSLLYMLHQVPYFLIVLTCLTATYTQLFGRTDLTGFIANLRAHWENHVQHEESMKQLERQKQHQQQLQQQALGLAGLNHSTAAELGHLSGQSPEIGYNPSYQLFSKQSNLHYPPNATVVPGQERPAYSLGPGSVTYRDAVNKNLTPYPAVSRNWNNVGHFPATDSHLVGLIPGTPGHYEANSTSPQFQEANERKTLWSGMSLQRRSLHPDKSSKITPKPAPSIKSKFMNVIGFGISAPKPVGLTNNGQNMCFINSVIQCLARGPFLVEYLTADAAKELECTVAESELLSSLAELLDILTIDPVCSDYKIFSATRFRKAASMLNPSLVSPPGDQLIQQDAAEFLMWLLATLHNILNKNRQALECDPSMVIRDDKFSSPRLANLKLIYGDLNANRIRELKDQCRREIAAANGLENESYAEAIQRLSDLEWLTHKQANDTIIDNLFTGQLVEAYYSLEHGHISVNLQAFNVLPVPIAAPRYSTGRLLNIRLHHFSLKDVIYDTVTQRTDMTAPAGGFIYELYGLCLHLGGNSTSHGHYISYCLDGVKWYRMDDQDVSEVNMEYQLNTEEIRQEMPICFSIGE
ncbi:hypothetical protein Btru_061993 [Bulinus truncatus]|nr:hypothetical protein Btru_061993 [Bulinus truncatus]